MMTTPCALRIASAVGLFMTLHTAAVAEGARQPVKLTNTQLDRIAAGAFLTADGTGSANGTLSYSEVTVTTLAGLDGTNGGMAVGKVAANAASNGGAVATASSTLSLTLILP